MRKFAGRLISLSLAAVMMFPAVGTAMAESAEQNDAVWYTGAEELPDVSEGGTDIQPSGEAEDWQADVAVPTYEQAYNAMDGLRSKGTYPEGMTWTNFTPYGRDSNPYQAAYWFRGGAVKGARGGVGCAAFVFILSDAAFGDLPARTIDRGDFTFEDVKVGDILRVDNSHFVIVLQKSAGGVIIAEANYNKSVHWGRAMSVAEVKAANFLVTRYPENYVDPSEGNTDKVAQSGTENGLNWTLTKGGMLTITGSGAIPDYDPNESQTPSWNEYADSINAITIGNGVTSIGSYAFYQSNALSVLIPNSVTSIGQSAFQNSKLVGVTIPGSVQTIGDSAFRNCANLTSATISEGVKTVGQNTFRGCTAIGYMDFPSSITSLGAGAFMDCTSIVQIRFAPGTAAVTMGDNLFMRCQRLLSVFLPEKADRISSGMFANCNLLLELYIPSGVSSIYEVGVPGSTGPFSQSALSVINYGGSEADWNAKGGKQALTNMNNGGKGVTVNFNAPFNNPFAPDKDDPGDLVTDPDTPHEHAWSDAWESDGTHHWHACTAPGCPITANSQKNGYAAHDAAGADGACSICGYKASATDPDGHTHSWASAWTNDGAHHWHECAADGCTVTDNSKKDGYAEHSYDAWVTDTAASASQAGSRHRDCTVCGYRQTGSIPATGGSTGGTGGTPWYPPATTPSGSTTTTVTNPQTGIKTETTKKPDGSTIVVTTQKDGTAVTVTTDAAGKSETEVKVSAAAINAAGQSGQPVALPVAAVDAAKNAAQAPSVTVRTEKGGSALVAIPVTSPSAGTVAVLVNRDGSTSIIKTSVPVDNSVVASVADGAVVKIVDNGKDFSDVHAGAWEKDAVDFVSARELFAGTSDTTFSPESTMTRAMLMTVLSRFDGVDTSGGAAWYTKGAAWAVERGISDGTNLSSGVTREQLVTMLWRYLGSPAGNAPLTGYRDIDQISGYTQEAMRWAVANGIVSGFGDGRLAPQAQATRAQVAQILKNFIESETLN